MGFLYFAPALAMIARRTGGYNIRPDVLAAHVAWKHVIHRQPVIALPTILTGIIVASKHLTPRQFDAWSRTVDLHSQPND
jgi:hypothetical protein